MLDLIIKDNLIALWGAGLATVLAIIKIWEMWSNRSCITTNLDFSSSYEIGNNMIINNISDKPLLVDYWELQFCKLKWFGWEPFKTGPNEYEMQSNMRIEKHSSKTINFNYEYHFENIKYGERIYLKLYIAGKRSPAMILVKKW